MVRRRSELTCPGHSMKMMTKAAASEADVVIFDLEDACAVSQKAAARKTVAEALRTLPFTGKKLRNFRVNGTQTPFCHRDLIEVLEGAGAFVDAVVLPKVTGAEDVHFADRLLTQLERELKLPVGRIALEVLIETASALLHAEDIARASKRVASLIFGIADYAADTGAKNFKDDPAMFHYPRAHLLAVARAHGLDAIDSVTVQYQDLQQLERDAQAAARLGFDGKWAIHPAQLPAINAAFTPSDDELAHARRVVEAYEKADREGLGAIVLDDEMVDEATVKVERKKLARAGSLR